MTFHGRVKNGVVVLPSGCALQDGTDVAITPLATAPGSGAAILAALESAPPVPSAWVDELDRMIAEGQRPAPPVTF
jgi:hypothetical protein